MEHFGADANFGAGFDKGGSQGLQGGAQAAGGGGSHAAQQVDRQDLADQGVGGDGQYKALDDAENGQTLDDRAEAHHGAGVDQRHQGVGGGLLQIALQSLPQPGEADDDQIDDGHQQGDEHRPVAGHRAEGGIEALQIGRIDAGVVDLREEQVDSHDEDEGNDGVDDARQILLIYAADLVLVVAIALPLQPGGLLPPGQPQHAAAEHQDGGDDAQHRGGKGVGAEVGHGDGVLHLRRAGQGGHGEGERAQGDGAGDQPLGNVGLTEQGDGDGQHHKGDHEQGHAAVGQDGAAQHYRQDGLILAQPLGNGVGDGVGIAGHLHQLGEHRAEQIQREIAFGVVGKAGHVGLGIVGHQVGVAAGGKHHGDQSHDGGDDDDAVSSESQENQEEQG